MSGLYLHIPFCKTRCIYCDFFSSVSEKKKSQYVDALCRELILQKDYLDGEPVQTIYFGGGTPSQLEAKEFKQIFDCISSSGLTGNLPVKEITLEVNPDDISSGYLESIRHLPFNRISMGVQSFDDSELSFLNRRHNEKKAVEAIHKCKQFGFNNISIDLIYGLPGQTMEGWKATLQQALALEIQHISAYHLIYEEGTRLYDLMHTGKILPVDENISVEMFSEMIVTLENAGFEHYEISNFARPGFIAQHNSSYWNGTHYLGAGASAHSFNGKSRHWNISNLNDYIESASRGNIRKETEIIGPAEAYNDFILTRLRTMWGIDLTELEKKFGEDKKSYCLSQARKHLANQTLRLSGDKLTLTRKGIFVSDGIMSDLFLE